MKTSSAKAKGRRLCLGVALKMVANAPNLQPEDIRVTSSGACGEDLLLSPQARVQYPWAVECKNQERVNLWASWKQAKSHVKFGEGRDPVLVLSKNHSEVLAVVSLEHLLTLQRLAWGVSNGL